jgi:hypothetical protein
MVLVTPFTIQENQNQTLECIDHVCCDIAVAGQAARDMFEPEDMELEKFLHYSEDT